MDFWAERTGALERLVTDRDGGASPGPWASLNLGGHVGDDPSRVERNRRILADRVGVPRERLLFLQQCHGADVVQATGPWPGEAPVADAVVSTHTDLALAVLVADCVPILLSDNQSGVIAAVHAGRPGLAAGVVDAAVDACRDLGARTLTALVGPSVCARCYEVPGHMCDEVSRAHPAARAVSWTGTPALDVAAGVVARLHARHVEVQWLAGCTRERTDLYSHRRDQPTGRFAAVIVRHEEAS